MGKKNKPTKSDWAEVSSSIVHGQGMFAVKDISEGTEVIEYFGERIDKEESVQRGHALLDESQDTGGAQVYLFTLDDTWDLDGNFDWNTARLVNHSCDPNCEAQIDKDLRIWLVALRDIEKGEELSFNYGFDLEDYQKHPCRCGSRKCVGYIAGEDYWPKLRRKLKKKKAKTERKAARKRREAVVEDGGN
ncbi:MAG: SET domain-containing protein-lysine N-methyltransferase [Verrucomicrobiales bacterium]